MECYIGQVMLVPYIFAPEGWLDCDGRMLNISQYDALFSLIGTIYGGDGTTTFALPDLRGRTPIGTGASSPFGTAYRIGDRGGCETVALDAAALPAHSHELHAATAPGTQKSPANAALAGGKMIYADGGSPPVAMAPACTPAGMNQPHDNMGPYLPLKWIIAVDGIYPVQD